MIVEIAVEIIESNPWQTRHGEPDPEYIAELAADIERNGLLQAPAGRVAIDGRPVDPQAYVSGVGAFYCPGGVVQLAFGHNRLAAIRSLGWERMPVELRVLGDEQMAVLAWSENERRREHTPHERALAVQRRIEDFGWTQAQAAEQLGISRSAVANTLRLLKLPEKVLQALAGGKITERVAMALIGLHDLPDELREQAERGYQLRPSVITSQALNGELTSDRIREMTNQICGQYGRRLDEAIWQPDEAILLERARSETCKGCAYRFADRNVCLDPACYEIKRQAVIADYLEKAGEACGIAPLEIERYYGYGDTTAFTHYGSKSKHFETILKSGCGSLRLKFQKVRQGAAETELADRVEGFPHAQIVCGKREQFCTCLKGLEYADNASRGSNGSKPAEERSETDRRPAEIEQPPVDAERLKELAKAARQEKRDVNRDAKDIVRETAERIATGLAMNNHKTWKRVAEHISYKARDVDERDLFAIRMVIAMRITEGRLPYQITTYESVLKRMNELLEDCGLEPIVWQGAPAAEEPAEEAAPAGKTLVEVFDGPEVEG